MGGVRNNLSDNGIRIFNFTQIHFEITNLIYKKVKNFVEKNDFYLFDLILLKQ